MPVFGFVGERDRSEPGETRPPREGFLETHFAEYDGPPPPADVVDLGGKPVDVRVSRRGWVTVFNRGKAGRGFAFCHRCGYAGEGGRRRRAAQRPTHTVPDSSKECQGSVTALHLGHRFLTNVMEIELAVDGGSTDRNTAALSALHGMLAALPIIGISQQDVGGALSVGVGGRPSVVIYDDVPGGAGHTRYIRKQLLEVVSGAVTRLMACSCGLETSCYGCLRNYRNQREHDLLNRGAAIEVLSALIRPVSG
ncbi:MAG: DUF1998 domain-containing protein [Acidimicrobiales bacterium]